MKKVCWPYFDPEFDTLPERINGPSCRVCIDNESSKDSTVIKVDSVNKQDLLLEVVQIITDLNLSITKGYISSDAGWFMDVFHVKDEHGNKLLDQKVLNSIQQAIGTGGNNTAMSPKKTRPKEPSSLTGSRTAIEMTATDRPGLFSEITAALAEMECNIVEAHAWSHNATLACVAYISDHSSSLSPVLDPLRLASIQHHLNLVLRATPTPLVGSNMKQQEVKTADVVGGESTTITNVERRLHQLMLSGRDYDMPSSEPSTSPRSPLDRHGHDQDSMKAIVSIDSCDQKGYSIVSVECRDRSRVMFDTVCTLIDMGYVIFHASVRCRDGSAFQEYFIRHRDGSPLNTENEKDRVIKCLEAAIERRVCEGVKLELCANNRIGLLSDITRVLKENGLAVLRADIATEGEKAFNAFYLRETSGKKVDMQFIESVKKEMSPISLHVKNDETSRRSCQGRYHFSLADMLKSHLDRFSQSKLL